MQLLLHLVTHWLHFTHISLFITGLKSENPLNRPRNEPTGQIVLQYSLPFAALNTITTSIKKIEYMNLLTAGKLNAHLIEVDQQAQDMYDQLIHQMAARAGITEQLKATDQMAWVQQMNIVSNQVRKIVSSELIYT